MIPMLLTTSLVLGVMLVLCVRAIKEARASTELWKSIADDWASINAQAARSHAAQLLDREEVERSLRKQIKHFSTLIRFEQTIDPRHFMSRFSADAYRLDRRYQNEPVYAERFPTLEVKIAPLYYRQTLDQLDLRRVKDAKPYIARRIAHEMVRKVEEVLASQIEQVIEKDFIR